MTDKTKIEFELLIRNTLNLQDSVNLTEVRYGSPPNWDSIRHVELFIALQNKFRVTFSTDEIVNLNSYTALREVLLQKVKR